MPTFPPISVKRTVCLTEDDESTIEQIKANYAPFEIKTHHIMRIAIRNGLADLLAKSAKPAADEVKRAR